MLKFPTQFKCTNLLFITNLRIKEFFNGWKRRSTPTDMQYHNYHP